MVTKTITKDGQQLEVRENANGTWSDVVTGRIAVGTKQTGEGGLITKETASLMAVRKGEIAAERAQQAVLTAVRKRHPEIETGTQGWGLIIEALATFALDGELLLGKGKKLWSRERLAAITLLGRASRYLTSEKQAELEALKISEMNVQNNYYAEDPEFTEAFLNARCPECNEIRMFGKEHVCGVIEAELKSDVSDNIPEAEIAPEVELSLEDDLRRRIKERNEENTDDT